jgi:formylglycine-generating enzyme required for sulfatase activity
VRGELDWIVMKALEKDRARRYRTATSLADDVRRYLLGEPVLAVPPAAGYRLRKFVRRHRVLVGTTGAVVAALALGVVGFAWQASRIREQERRATALAADVLSLSAFQELQELVERADALWPAVPAQVPAYDRWLADARQLLEGRAADAAHGSEAHPGVREHEASLAGIRTRALPRTADGAYEFADARDRWWHTQLVRLLGELRKFGDPQSGLATAGNDPEHGWGIVKRREFAATVAERSLDGDDVRRRWAAATAAIAAHPRYGGLQLRPQLGLVPLGADPASGLWEFGHLQTGEPAKRRADGSLELLEASGLVFVLLPGGTFAMGAQRDDPNGPNHDPQALPVEGPVHTVTLSPFFLSKYEMTQAQWLHCTGVNPSHLRPDKRQPSVKSLLHPVEQVSWTMCRTQLERMQLALPSEAQWEYGTRAGTGTVWWTGDARESLRGAVNIADQAAARAGAPWTDIQDWPELDDGFVMHAPVASLRANAFGLHGVHGNVFEWCFDGYDPKFYASSPTQDPVRATEGTTTRINRGGCFSNTAALARSANRPSDPPQTADRYLGVRPARAIQ